MIFITKVVGRLTHQPLWIFVYLRVDGPHPSAFIRKRNALLKGFVCAEGAIKVCVTESIRTHFLSCSQVYFAERRRLPTTLNNSHFDLILNSMRKFWMQNASACNLPVIPIFSSQWPPLVNNLSAPWKFTHLTFQLISCINYCHKPWNLAFCKWITGELFHILVWKPFCLTTCFFCFINSTLKHSTTC